MSGRASVSPPDLLHRGLTELEVDRLLALQEEGHQQEVGEEAVSQLLAEEEVDGVVVVQALRHIGVPKKGSYVVKEEIQKPPKHDHSCNLTLTAVKIAFPEMKSEVFVNLLGYKEPNLVHLARCKGQCVTNGSPIACSPTKLKDTVVNMKVDRACYLMCCPGEVLPNRKGASREVA